jgi:hypothetical protein
MSSQLPEQQLSLAALQKLPSGLQLLEPAEPPEPAEPAAPPLLAPA